MRILDLSTALLDEACDPDERRQESMGAGIAKRSRRNRAVLSVTEVFQLRCR